MKSWITEHIDVIGSLNDSRLKMNWNNDPLLGSLRHQLVNHKLYQLLDSPIAVRTFMQHHVWCVWDFQSLLKALQNSLTCTKIPWVPSSDLLTRRLINEIVLGEESDEDGMGGYLSHFELYLKAMREIHADTSSIDNFINLLREGETFEESLAKAAAPSCVIPFVKQTINLAQSGSLHKIAAAFTLGREDLLPDIFLKILSKISERYDFSHSILTYYLDRHIKLDGDEHGPMAIAMLDKACDGLKFREEEALTAAKNSLQARLDLWDAICIKIKS